MSMVSCQTSSDGENMLLGLQESLPSLVARRFTAAKKSGSLVFSHTEVTTLKTSTVPFQLRYCPALAQKPTAPPRQPQVNEANVKPDPFQDPHTDLLIAHIPRSNPTHALVLNKYPVISNHFILATKPFKPQTHLLEADDLQAAYACLRAWETSPHDAKHLPREEKLLDDWRPETPPIQKIEKQRRLFAFFNSGEHSGASQPHRHLQFLPVEDMKKENDEFNWAPLIEEEEDEKEEEKEGDDDESQDKTGHHHHKLLGIDEAMTGESYEFPKLASLPFVCYATPLPPNPTPDALHRTYLSLYTMAVTAAAQYSESLLCNLAASGVLETKGESVISYNLAMTTSRMMICPRRSEHAWLPLGPEPKQGLVDEGLVKLNGTILAGTLLVKAEAEWNALRARPSILEGVLMEVGIPTSAN
ncbi:bifunctional AP-4-A phosphorylase/ADP sulfurylase [Myotisia sp. PD_48]|nr:bifunctional AP-4-A phosphorylase/ADP sulfurylase [Myotisia sp. PD_48]